MSGIIRLQKVLEKNEHVYMIVVEDEHSMTEGGFREIVGKYDPTTVPATVTLKGDKIRKWLSRGAMPSRTVRGILEQQGIFTSNVLQEALSGDSDSNNDEPRGDSNTIRTR